VEGRVAGPLGGYEARGDAVRINGGVLDSSPCVAEASEVCRRYYVRSTEERFRGSRVKSEAAGLTSTTSSAISKNMFHVSTVPSEGCESTKLCTSSEGT
jgi:hypothetical protein